MKHTEEYWKDMACYVQTFEDLDRKHRVATNNKWDSMTSEEQDWIEHEARQWIHVLRTDVTIDERVV